MSPHQNHDILRSGGRIAIQLQARYRARRCCWNPVLRTEPLRREQKTCLPTPVHHARADDIYPASRPPSLAAGRMPLASIRSLHTPQQEPGPRPSYAAFASLPIHSWLQSTTNRGTRTGCVAQTDTDVRRAVVGIGDLGRVGAVGDQAERAVGQGYFRLPAKGVIRLISERILPADQVVPDAPYQIRASDLQSEPVAAAIARKDRPCRLNTDGQLPMFIGTSEGGAQ